MSTTARDGGAGRPGTRGVGGVRLWCLRALLALASFALALTAAELWVRTLGEPPLLVGTLPGRVSPAAPRDTFVPFDIERVPRRTRVLIVGASTEAGFPYGPRASLASWVERTLAWRGANVEVVPVACPGLTAAQTAALMPELLTLGPAAIVVGLGHNEFLHNARQLETRWWRRLALVQRLLAPHAGDAIAETPLPTVAHDFDRAGIIAAFEDCLASMRKAAEAGGVPLLITTPVSNLLCPPGIGDLPDLASGADAVFEAGCAQRAAGDAAAARASLERAVALDYWPQRAPPALQDAVLHCGAHVVRTDLALEALSPDGIGDFTIFIDHCHPSPGGMRALATAIADALETHQIVPATGRLGQAPDLATLRGALDISLEHEAAVRGEAAVTAAGLALAAQRHGALARLADRQLEAAGTGAALPDAPGAGRIVLAPQEASAWRAFLALQNGDVDGCRSRLEALERSDPAGAARIGAASRHYPWIVALFKRHGLSLPGGG